MPIKILVDTNFLMTLPRYHLDIISEIERLLLGKVELVVPEPVFDELYRLSREDNTNVRKDALIALALAKSATPLAKTLLPRESTDDLLVRIASELRIPVATNDAGLRKRLRDINIAVVYLRQLRRLAIEGAV